MPPRHYSQLYRQLRDVNPVDHQRVIRMYEEKESEIGQLDVVENFELTVYYADALFATGAYRQHQMMVDLVIEACMRHNISKMDGVEGDVFRHLLFRKAASAFRLQRFDEAGHVARELIRIDPSVELNVRFLRASLFRRQRDTLQRGRAGFIGCILISAAIITGEILIIRTVYPELLPYSQAAIAVTFLAGVLCLLGFYGYAYARAHYGAYGFQRGVANKCAGEG